MPGLGPPQRASGNVRKWVDETMNGLRAESQERNNLIRGLRKQRMLRLKPRPPEAYQKYLGEGVRVPISFRLVETVVGAVAGEEKAQFFASSPDVELAQRASTWCNLILQAQERVSQSALYYRYWDGLVADGMVALKTVRQAWTDFPIRMEEETDEQYNDRVEAFIRQRPPVPFRTRVVDPSTFYPPRSEWGRVYAAESGLRPTREVFEQLGIRPTRGGGFRVAQIDEPTPLDMPGLRMGPRIQVDELWTEENLFVRVHGHVFVYENELGVLPYKWTSGSALAFSDPTLQSMSVLYPLQYLEPWVNQHLSVLLAESAAMSTPTPQITHQATGTAAGGGEPQISDFEAGRLHNMPPGSKLEFAQPNLDAASINLLNTMVQLAERFTLQPIPPFAGTRTPGVVLSAVAERIMSVLKPRIDQAKTTWSEQMKFYFDLTQRVVRAPVAVSGMVFEEKTGRSRMTETVLTPRDISKISDVLTEIRFQTIQDKIAWHTHNVMMFESGLWTMERAMRESDVKDPEQERQTRLLDEVRRNPVVQQYIMQKGMAGQPPLEALQELLEQAGQQSGGVEGVIAQGASQRVQGGRNPGEPRAPGGTRPQTASAAV